MPGWVVGNDLAGRVGASEAETKAKIDKGRTKSRRTPEHSARTTRPGAIGQDQPQPRREPSGLGYGRRQREFFSPTSGTPPRVEPIGEWHFGKDGARDGPPPNPETAAKPGTAETDGRHEPTMAASPASALNLIALFDL